MPRLTAERHWMWTPPLSMDPPQAKSAPGQPGPRLPRPRRGLCGWGIGCLLALSCVHVASLTTRLTSKRRRERPSLVRLEGAGRLGQCLSLGRFPSRAFPSERTSRRTIGLPLAAGERPGERRHGAGCADWRLATSRAYLVSAARLARRAPWLCVPASRRVCPFVRLLAVPPLGRSAPLDPRRRLRSLNTDVDKPG